MMTVALHNWDTEDWWRIDTQNMKSGDTSGGSGGWDSSLPMQGLHSILGHRTKSHMPLCSTSLSYASELSSNVDIMFCILTAEGIGGPAK